MSSVLFVCLGNICRSPLAEGAFTAHVERAGHGQRYVIDSAGTGGWHAGEGPDPRSVAVARSHGLDISHQRARQVRRDDFARFAHIIAMDRSNLRELERLRRVAGGDARLGLLLDELPDEHTGEREVPDPYYGGPGGFSHVWRLVDAATAALLERLERGG